jgi:hypothetical protein
MATDGTGGKWDELENRPNDLVAVRTLRMEARLGKQFVGGATDTATVLAAPVDRERAEHGNQCCWSWM